MSEASRECRNALSSKTASQGEGGKYIFHSEKADSGDSAAAERSFICFTSMKFHCGMALNLG
eukprot:768603-Hanusia_phi.AAC.9